jgi:hypothetical protein
LVLNWTILSSKSPSVKSQPGKYSEYSIAIATDVAEMESSEDFDVVQWKKRLYKVEEDRRSDLLSTKLSYRNTFEVWSLSYFI